MDDTQQICLCMLALCVVAAVVYCWDGKNTLKNLFHTFF